MEITLAFIFCSIFDDTKTPLPSGYTEWSEMSVTQRMLHSIMDAIIGFDTRIDVISAAVRDANISPLLKTIWGKLNARLKKKYKSRHQIAHFMILEIEEEGKPTCYRLTPFATSTTTSEEVRLQTADVNTKKQNFHELREALLWFGNQVEFEKKRIEAPGHLQKPLAFVCVI